MTIRVARVGQHGDARKTGKQLLEQLQPLALLLGHLHRHPGDVAARTRKTGDNTGTDRISCGHHDRYGGGGLVAALLAWFPEDAVALNRKIAGRERGNTLGISLKRYAKRWVFAFDVFKIACTSSNPSSGGQEPFARTPIFQMRPGAWAMATPGHAATALPKSLMNSRRPNDQTASHTPAMML